MKTKSRIGAIALSFCFAMLGPISPQAAAQDIWTAPAPGVSYLERTTTGPRKIHAAVVDISRADLYVRATRPEERGRTTSNFAQQVDAVIAINGDWGNASFQPFGLAVGDGQHWENTADQGWAFIACNIENQCHYGTHQVNEELHWRWHEVVGGNGWRLLIDGEIPTYPPESFYTDRHPRSAVGTSQDGSTMYFVVVEGRRTESIGMGFAEMASLMKDLGAYQALMLDGGGSSSLVINQSRVNNLPANQSTERTVTNHLAILRGTPDPRCTTTPNGRYCEGSIIHTCRGGSHKGQGDCGFFGATCDVTTGGVGVCTHHLCINGPEKSFCESDTIIRTCTDGRPGDLGDCAFFGATCEDGVDDSYCLHFACPQGGNAQWCEGFVARHCINGQPQDDVDCADSERICVDGQCQIPNPSPGDADEDLHADPDGDHDGDHDEILPDTDRDTTDTDVDDPVFDGLHTTTTSSCSTSSGSTNLDASNLLLLLLGLLGLSGLTHRRRAKSTDDSLRPRT